MPNLLELFAGSRSVGKVATQFGFRVYSVDVQPFDGIDLVEDISKLHAPDFPFVPDVLWASPPCTTYSIAAVGHHRDGVRPKTEFAEQSDRLLEHTLKVIDDLLSLNPAMVYFVENPVGMMRKMPQMNVGMMRCSVTYCSYGDDRMKPTDIWTNHARSIINPNGWEPRPKCFNGNGRCHHARAPRGSDTGTQGRDTFEAGKIPVELVEEIFTSLKGI